MLKKKRAHRTHIIENQISDYDPAARNVSTADTTWKKQFGSLCIHKELNLRSSVQCLGLKYPTSCVKGPETPSSSPSPNVWQKSKSCRNLPVIVLRFLRNHTYLYRWKESKSHESCRLAAAAGGMKGWGRGGGAERRGSHYQITGTEL